MKTVLIAALAAATIGAQGKPTEPHPRRDVGVARERLRLEMSAGPVR